MVGTVLIRPMTAADVPTCLRIEQGTYPIPWTTGIFLDELAAPGRAYMVAEIDGDVVGYAGLMLVLPEAHITSVTVEPSRRGLGIGTRLMVDLVDRARVEGATSLTLEVRMSNRAAQSLYGRFGMAPVGIRKAYYKDEDALIMWVHDLDGDEYQRRIDEIRATIE